MHERLKDILAEAIARSGDPDERRRIVRERCGDDTELLEAALSLIAYAPATGDRSPANEDDRPLDSDGTIVLDGGPSTPGPLGPHVRLGPYRLIDVLGHGASGVVWRARQESFDRDVAIKVLERGGGQEIFLTRFRREQQILASLSHPGIAQVHDAGTTPQGFPFYVMELLEGSDVSTHCDERRLDVRTRISLVIRICRAVQHAHQRGVIHRDLKPSNVLCIVDDEGVSRPKVIDFGIARSESSIGDVTEQGVVLGTLLYMSPEQIQTSHDVDVTTDVYSLGVIAYELLVGERPGERLIDHEKGLLENLRILEREPTPSLLSRLDPDDDDVLERARARNTTPEALRDELRGEPEWIVQMATAKDRRERYGSVEEFARDLEHHLDGRVVRAAPPGVGYRTRKFVRRHRAPIAAFTAIFVALLGGLIVSTWSYLQAESARAVIAERLTTSRLLAAEASLQAADVQSARTALAAVDPGRRGWLWNLLSRKTDASRYQHGWNASPRAIRVDASGGILVATSAGDVHAWSPGTEDVGPPLVSSGGNVQQVGFLDTTGRIVFTTDTNEVFVRSSAPSTVERVGRAGVTVVAVEPVPDGGGVLVASIDGRVVEFPMDGQAPRTLFDPGPIREWCNDLSVDRDGVLVALATTTDSVRVVDRREGAPILTFGIDATPTSLAFDPETRRLAVGGRDGVIRVRWIDQPRIDAFIAHPAAVLALEFTRDGQRLISADEQGRIHAFDTRSWDRVGVAYGHRGSVTALLHDPERRRIVSVGSDSTTRVWSDDLQITDVVAVKIDSGDRGALISPRVVVVRDDDRLVLDRSATGGDRTVVLGDVSRLALFAITEDESWVVVADADGSVVAVPTDGSSSPRTLSADVGLPWSVAAARRLVAVGDDRGRVHWWNLESGHGVTTGPATGPAVGALALDEERGRLALGTDEGTVVVLETATGDTLFRRRAHLHSPVSALCFAEIGSPRIYSAARAHRSGGIDPIRGWSVPDGVPLSDLDQPESSVESMVVHPFEGWIAVAEREARVRIFDPDTETPLARLQPAGILIDFAAFDPETGSLYTITNGGMIERW